MDPTTTVLLERGKPPGGLSRMVGISMAVHVGLVAGLFAMPQQWRHAADRRPASVMTISLGGAPGPRTGGLSQLGGRPIQQLAPLPAARRPEAVRPPARTPPKMPLPTPRARRTPAPPPMAQAPQEARGQRPTEGPELRRGDAIAETGSTGVGFGGLSSGGGGGGGSYLEGITDFCCPEYILIIRDRIRRVWNSRHGVAGQTVVKFTIQRDGLITDVEIERSSGYLVLDEAARRAVLLARQLPPLPAVFDRPALTVHLNFEYQR